MARWLPAKGYAGRSAGSILKKVTSTFHYVFQILNIDAQIKAFFELATTCVHDACNIHCLVVVDSSRYRRMKLG